MGEIAEEYWDCQSNGRVGLMKEVVAGRPKQYTARGATAMKIVIAEEMDAMIAEGIECCE